MGPALMTVKGRSIVVGGGLFCTTATLLLRMSPVTFPWSACPAAPAAAPASLPAETHTHCQCYRHFSVTSCAKQHFMRDSCLLLALALGTHQRRLGRPLKDCWDAPDCMSSCLVSIDVVACRLPESFEPITTAHQHTSC